jgi:hypothetical protein
MLMGMTKEKQMTAETSKDYFLFVAESKNAKYKHNDVNIEEWRLLGCYTISYNSHMV